MTITNTQQKNTDPQADVVPAKTVAPGHPPRPDKPAATRRDAGQPSAAERSRPSETNRSETPGVFVVDNAGDVRAGPGDAGATDRPRVLDDPREKAPSSRWMMLTMLAVALVTLVAILAL